MFISYKVLHANMDGGDNLESFQPDPEMAENVDDNFTVEQLVDMEDYPLLSRLGNCAKDYDPSLLQN